MKKVLIPTKLDPVAAEILGAHGEYEVVQDDTTPLLDQCTTHADTHALIVRSEKVTPEVIDALPQLRVIVRAGAGYNTIDTKYARSKRIDVMNTPGANSNAVAEEVVAMMLADARHVVRADPSTRAGKWEKKSFMGREITGKTVGIVGLGNIGQLVAKRLSGFDCQVLGYDPVISTEKAAAAGIELKDLDEVFAEADYITLHIPENDNTRGIVGESLLATMKKGATIVNCARAGVIDEEALRAVKAEKGIRFLNDVYAKDVEGDKSVTDIADLMLPHLGASTVEANEAAARRSAEQLIELDEKGVTSYIVNRDIPAGLDEEYCELAFLLAKLCRSVVSEHAPLKLLETSVYGTLAPYSKWLLTPMVAGICSDFDRSMDYHEARAFLEEMGVDYVNRDVDPQKGFENSITVDLCSEIDAENMKRTSIRGTVAEGTLMVSRINEFNKLYFEPVGNTIFFLYDDRPGVIGAIGSKLAEASINIEDMRNPHDPKTNRSLAILRVDQPVAEDLMNELAESIGARASFCISF